MTAPEKTVTLYGAIMGRTAKALKFSCTGIRGSEEEFETPEIGWFPISQVLEERMDLPAPYIVVKEWICKTKGMI